MVSNAVCKSRQLYRQYRDIGFEYSNQRRRHEVVGIGELPLLKI